MIIVVKYTCTSYSRFPVVYFVEFAYCSGPQTLARGPKVASQVFQRGTRKTNKKLNSTRVFYFHFEFHLSSFSVFYKFNFLQTCTT